MPGYCCDSCSITTETIAAATGSADPIRNSPLVGSARIDLLYSLLELIEDRGNAFDQRAAIAGGFDSLRVAIEQPHPELPLHVGDRLRHRGLRNRETRGGSCHAPSLHHGQENMQIVQLQTFPDRASQRMASTYKAMVMLISYNKTPCSCLPLPSLVVTVPYSAMEE